jgi:hypothetical protein
MAAIVIRQENRAIVSHPFPQKDAEMDGAPKQYSVAGSIVRISITRFVSGHDFSRAANIAK